MPTTAMMIDALVAMRNDPQGPPVDHFWQLVERFRADLVNQAYGILGRQEDAQDCAQASLAKSFRLLHTLKDASKLGRWMRTINRKTALKMLRSKKRAKVHAAGTGFHSSGLAATNPQSEQDQRDTAIEQVARVVDGLSDIHREVVVLRYWEHKSLEEIAKILNVPLGTVKSRLARADQMLLVRLKRLWSEE